MPLRIGAFIAIILFVLGLGVSFAPSSSAGSSCGNWVSPNWPLEDSMELAEKWDDLGDRGTALQVASVARDCSDKLVVRRNITIGLGFLAFCALISPLVVPDRKGLERAVEEEMARREAAGEFDDDEDDVKA